MTTNLAGGILRRRVGLLGVECLREEIHVSSGVADADEGDDLSCQVLWDVTDGGAGGVWDRPNLAEWIQVLSISVSFQFAQAFVTFVQWSWYAMLLVIRGDVVRSIDHSLTIRKLQTHATRHVCVCYAKCHVQYTQQSIARRITRLHQILQKRHVTQLWLTRSWAQRFFEASFTQKEQNSRKSGNPDDELTND